MSEKKKKPSKSGVKKKKVTHKQEVFAREYAKHGNATKSAMIAYDCTEKSARTIGSENLTKLDVQERIKELEA